MIIITVIVMIITEIIIIILMELVVISSAQSGTDAALPVARPAVEPRPVASFDYQFTEIFFIKYRIIIKVLHKYKQPKNKCTSINILYNYSSTV